MKKYHRMPEVEPSFLYGQENAVLLETNRFGPRDHLSYIFVNPVDVLVAEAPGDVPGVLAALERYAAGHWLAGYFAYELGYCFEERLSCGGKTELPLIWLGVFEKAAVFDHRTGEFGGAEGIPFVRGPARPEPFGLTDVGLQISRADYERRIERIKRYIEAGDIYQANFTTKYRFGFEGCAYSLYRELKLKQEVAYNAFIKMGRSYVLSISPELFIRKEGRAVTTRPMKGTAGRGRTLEEDGAQADFLRGDPKNRSENLMIVDLLRNDLGRICRTGSVRVEELFTVERYNTLFQMTSTVTAELREGVGIAGLLRSVFPSGSVTGAPKIRAIEVIQELEAGPRGVYTGAVGFIRPGGDAVLNISIRTVAIADGKGEMGVGSGIVYDSDPAGEYEECKLKAAFLLRQPVDFSLVETMLWDGGPNRLELHLRRLGRSAEYFGFDFDADAVRAEIKSAEAGLAGGRRYRLRLLLARDGSLGISATEMGEEPAGPRRAALSGIRTSRDDVFLYHKTTHRGLYDSEYRKHSARGYFDVIFTNQEGEVTEGAITNVFIKKDGVFYTPPVDCGLLDGVYRAEFMASHPECR